MSILEKDSSEDRNTTPRSAMQLGIYKPSSSSRTVHEGRLYTF